MQWMIGEHLNAATRNGLEPSKFASLRQVRAFTPEPGAWTTFRGDRLVLAGATVSGGTPKEHGVLEIHDGRPEVASGAGWLRLELVRPAGKRTMTGEAWARGLRGITGARLPS